MKRFLSVFCAAAILFSATACNTTNESQSLPQTSSTVSNVSSEASPSESEETPASSATPDTGTEEPSASQEPADIVPVQEPTETSPSQEPTETASAKPASSSTEETAPAATNETSSETTPAQSEAQPETPANKLKLSNPNASKEAQALFDYICGTYRNGILSGQQESTWMGSDQYEFEYIYNQTGKYPAIRGLDYMNDDFNGVNKRAIEWHKRGGIVTICWHCGCDFSGSWAESMNTEISDWDKALTEGTPEYEKLIKGMDKAAAALQKLEAENIPVLWRPFHEFDGAWFWWGKGGAENFKKLWKLMYDRYTNYWGLDNLIWVLGYSQNGKNYAKWYPGDEYVDIAGADSYRDGANGKLYSNVGKVVGDDMPICFHECGRIPTVEQLKKADAQWVWFMTWHTEYITDHNKTDDLKKIYNDDYVITLDELPDLY